MTRVTKVSLGIWGPIRSLITVGINSKWIWPRMLAAHELPRQVATGYSEGHLRQNSFVPDELLGSTLFLYVVRCCESLLFRRTSPPFYSFFSNRSLKSQRQRWAPTYSWSIHILEHTEAYRRRFYLFVPVRPINHEDEHTCLHYCTHQHSAPDPLHINEWSALTIWHCF